MIAHIGFAGNGTISAPDATWTLLQTGATTGTVTRVTVFYKIATSTDVAATDFTFTSTDNVVNKGTISTFSGHDHGVPIGTSSVQVNGTSSTCTAATITPPVANCMIVWCGFSASGSRTFSGWTIATSPPIFNETYDTANTVSVAMAYGLRPETTATGAGTATLSGVARNVGILIAIQPLGTTNSSSSSSSSSYIENWSSSSSESSSSSSSTSSSVSSSSSLSSSSSSSYIENWSSSSSESSSSYILSVWNRLMIYTTAYTPNSRDIANGNNGTVLVGEHQLFDQRSGDLGSVCTDPSGNIYVADPIYNIVLKVLPNGIVMVWAGKTGESGNNGNNRVKGGDARFREPSGLICDNSGNVYVADRGNNQIRKITPDQYVTLVAGSITGLSGFVGGIGSAARFNSPNDVCVNKSGDIYVADTNNHAIRLIRNGTSLVNTVAGNGIAGDGYNGWNTDGSLQAILNSPYSVAAKPNGEILISDSGNHKIKLLDKNNRVLRYSGSGIEGSYLGDKNNEALTCQYNNLRYSDVDPSGNLYLIDYKSDLESRLLRIDGSGIPAIVRNFVDLNDNAIWEDFRNWIWESGDNAVWDSIITPDNSYVVGVGVNRTGVLFVTESEFGSV